MSGMLLGGIVGFGAAWVLGCRAVCAKAPPPTKPTEPTEANPDAITGAAAINGASAGGQGDVSLGGSTTIGTDAGGNTLPVSLGGPDGTGALVVDNTSSTGGADPATERTGTGALPPATYPDRAPPGDASSIWRGEWDEDNRNDPRRRPEDPALSPDAVSLWIGATHGSTEGLTKRQIAEAFTEVQRTTGQVVV